MMPTAKSPKCSPMTIPHRSLGFRGSVDRACAKPFGIVAGAALILLILFRSLRLGLERRANLKAPAATDP
jgi:uncharacterized membrane protein